MAEHKILSYPQNGALRDFFICVDVYENGLLQGRLKNAFLAEEVRFENLMQLIMAIEDTLRLMKMPRAFTENRSFWAAPRDYSPPAKPVSVVEKPSGEVATFVMKVIFRQYASWQGELFWCETAKAESFRSALELIKLLQSALGEQ